MPAYTDLSGSITATTRMSSISVWLSTRSTLRSVEECLERIGEDNLGGGKA
jgi:hypothetical protein